MIQSLSPDSSPLSPISRLGKAAIIMEWDAPFSINPESEP
jgi:hypothetical protein